MSFHKITHSHIFLHFVWNEILNTWTLLSVLWLIQNLFSVLRLENLEKAWSFWFNIQIGGRRSSRWSTLKLPDLPIQWHNSCASGRWWSLSLQISVFPQKPGTGLTIWSRFSSSSAWTTSPSAGRATTAAGTWASTDTTAPPSGRGQRRSAPPSKRAGSSGSGWGCARRARPRGLRRNWSKTAPSRWRCARHSNFLHLFFSSDLPSIPELGRWKRFYQFRGSSWCQWIDLDFIFQKDISVYTCPSKFNECVWRSFACDNFESQF